MSEWTHEALVDRAKRWLLNTRRCKFALTNAKPWSCTEHPDAIGWLQDGVSIVVEVKVSEDDFRADRKKTWRLGSIGMGMYRYYLTPAEFFDDYPCSLLEPDVGLLEAHGRIVKVIREARPRQQREWTQELSMLLAQLCGGTP